MSDKNASNLDVTQNDNLQIRFHLSLPKVFFAFTLDSPWLES